ncbi:type II toxin-antitoxin system HicB family antitoxin, partial [Lactobacillus reuteri]|nr:type II toxin-antitoxin system HicB family antitoxin [Limosilactobacillus reuteri]
MDDIKVFPIIITKDDNSDYPYFVEIPDIDGMTEGKSIADAMEMAKDYIGT